MEEVADGPVGVSSAMVSRNGCLKEDKREEWRRSLGDWSDVVEPRRRNRFKLLEIDICVREKGSS